MQNDAESRALPPRSSLVEHPMPFELPNLFRKACVLLVALLPVVATAAASRSTIARDADRVMPKAYNVGGALAIRDDVGYSFNSTAGPVRIDLGRITNESATTTSGTVRVGLFVTTSATPGGTYYVIGHSDLGTLGPNQFFGPLSHTVPYLPPPDGVYYLHMGAFEYEPGFCSSPDGYCLDDWVSFTNRVEVINGQIFDAGPPPPATTTVVEYYHTGFNHYFVTSFANEIALLDAGYFQGWVRTGRTFLVWNENNGGLSGMCRFFSTSFAPKSSHFYTPFADECATVQANSNWQFEAIAFYVGLPAFNGNCLPGEQPLYRLYNSGQGGAPNHRYTTSLDVRDVMLQQGWIPEGYGPFGAIACVPT
jgi:Repeat of unknown function (DUF5648)